MLIWFTGYDYRVKAYLNEKFKVQNDSISELGKDMKIAKWYWKMWKVCLLKLELKFQIIIDRAQKIGKECTNPKTNKTCKSSVMRFTHATIEL